MPAHRRGRRGDRRRTARLILSPAASSASPASSARATPDRSSPAAASRRPSSRSARPITHCSRARSAIRRAVAADAAVASSRTPTRIGLDVIAQLRHAHPGESVHERDAIAGLVSGERAKIPACRRAPRHNDRMPEDDPPPPRPSALVTDHPAPLNTLTEIFDRRNIAVGIDSSGQVVLARPDSLLAEVTTTTQRESLARYVERYDKEQAAADPRARRRQAACRSRRFGCGTSNASRSTARTAGPSRRVQQAMRELAALDTPIVAELNHVFLGAQVVIGNPLGAPATWAGEMAFLGNVIETKPDDKGVERKVMLSTAEPAEEPRFLRRRLEHRRAVGDRRSSSSTPGCDTVVEDGTRRAEHDFLDCCIVDGRPGETLDAERRRHVPGRRRGRTGRRQDRDARLRRRPRHVHRRGDRPAVPRRRDPHGGRAVELR